MELRKVQRHQKEGMTRCCASAGAKRYRPDTKYLTADDRRGQQMTFISRGARKASPLLFVICF